LCTLVIVPSTSSASSSSSFKCLDESMLVIVPSDDLSPLSWDTSTPILLLLLNVLVSVHS
jgi:hypothetical protein